MITEYSKYEPIFGAFYIKKEIGEGSFGKVYEIERDDFGGKFQAALKAITIPKRRDEIELLQVQRRNPTEYYKGITERILTEIELMTRLKGNSHIVSYENHQVINHEDGIGWDILIQMELLTPLYKYLYEKDISISDVVNLGIDICQALELCHANNIIHRDVKPENIFVSNQGYYKLGDFGVAKISDATGSGTKAGTESYMAPEVYNNEKYGVSADIYSLGLVMYMLLNNYKLPFEEQNTDNPYVARVFANSKRMSGVDLPPTVYGDDRLDRIIRKACSYNPVDRYRTAQEMRSDLENLAFNSTNSDLNYINSADKYGTVVSTATVREEPTDVDMTVAEYNPTTAVAPLVIDKTDNYNNILINRAPYDSVGDETVLQFNENVNKHSRQYTVDAMNAKPGIKKGKLVILSVLVLLILALGLYRYNANKVSAFDEPIQLVVVSDCEEFADSSYKSDLIQDINKGKEFYSVSMSKDFYSMAHWDDDEECWIIDGWINKENTKEIVPYSAYEYEIINLKTDVETAYKKGIALHTEPSIDSYTIARIKDEQPIKVIAIVDEGDDPYGYVKCIEEGLYGWMNLDYVRMTD